ncbi:L,D-transpeptidase family protein [Kitasatospora sp. NPDC001527]|uniref:L,D-transpeptidase family protein n=1 Tax=Kitasatospora sp. NPDC001527 TaxID=3154519 RepID=UPI00331E6292
MSGYRRTSPYPSYEPVYEAVYEAPQQSYGAQQQPYGGDQEYDAPLYQVQDQGHGNHDGDDGYDAYDAYDQPFRTSPAEPEARPQPEPAPLPRQRAAAAPAGGRAAARGHRRKPKKKRTGRVAVAGTALLLAAAAGWYTVGEDSARPGVTTADGPGPEGVGTPDRPAAQPVADQASPTAPAAQAADARQSEVPAAGRSEARADGSVEAIPGLGAAFVGRIPAETTQVVLASGEGRDTNRATVTLWSRTAEGRWLAGESWQGHNAFKGWTTDHNEGDLRSPIGVFSLTDAGGRKADPGSRLPYDKDANFVVSGTGFAGEQLAGSFDYVVAINYNRVPGNSPLDPRRPNGSTKGGGIWIHVDHGGPTHGCVSIPEDKMAQLIRTLDPAAHPVIVMGDAPSLAA